MTEKKEMKLPYISKDLHSLFKVICVAKGISMKNATDEAIREWIEKNKTASTEVEKSNN